MPQNVPYSILGRCVVSVDQDGNEAHEKSRVRIDTGTDEDIFDVTLMPFAERLGPSPKSYVSPLSPKPRRAERGRVTFSGVDVSGNQVVFTRTGIFDPFGASAFRPERIDVTDGVGTVTLCDYILPTVAINGNAYVDVSPVPTETSTKIKSIYDFCRNAGFSPGHPAPPLHIIAKILHLKHGCAGRRSLALTCKLNGYSLPAEAIASAIDSCHLCPDKQQHDSVGDLLPYSSLGRLAATADREI